MIATVRRSAAVLAILLVAGSGIAAAQTGTTAAVDRSSAEPGASVGVTGTGWPAGSRLQVSLCGNQALRGSIDCDLPGSRSVVTSGLGSFELDLTVAVPPAPCPCVVYVFAEGTTNTVRLPFEVLTAPAATSTEVPVGIPARAFEVDDVRLAGSGPWTSWFGMSPRRDLVLTLTNVGSTASAPQIELTIGKGDRPTGAVDAPALEELAPGESATYRVPVELDPLSVGSYSVAGQVAGSFGPAEFRASTSAYPWGLIALALVAVQLGLLRIRDRVRRRLAARAPELMPAEAVGDLPLQVDRELPRAADRVAPQPPVAPEVPVAAGVAALAGSEGTEPATEAPPSEDAPDDHAPEVDVPGDGVPGDRAPEAPAEVVLDLRTAEERADRIARRSDHARVEAARALADAELEGEALVIAAAERVAALDAARDDRLAEAEAQHESELELLDAVWRRAEELARGADAGLARRLAQIEAEQEEARQALAEAEAARAALVERARRALDLVGEAPSNGADDHPRPPRVDEIDKRLARAVERALASMGPDRAN